MQTLAILAAKLSSSILRCFGRGGSLPGSIALKIDDKILNKLEFTGPIILVTGTNGKTTVTHLIQKILIKFYISSLD